MKFPVVGLLLLYSSFPSWVVGEEDGVSTESSEESCGLYLAISSTSTVDETKWGIYAGKEYDAGEKIGYPEVAVNIFNVQANAGLDEETENGEGDEERQLVADTIDFFEQFIWVPVPAGGQFELEEGRAVTAIPGAGVLGGYNPALTNADWNQTSAYVRTADNEVSQSSHAGRGAYSNFFNVVLRSTTKIPAGREIFLDYGDNWEAEHEDEQLEADDYHKLDQTVQKMEAFFAKYESDLNDKAKREIYDFLIRDVMTAAVGNGKAKKIADALPANPDLLEQVQKQGGSYSYSQPNSQRDIQWLQNHGRCMDNIQPGPSTIANAGRGAFAVRAIKENQLVTPVPLIHIPADSLMDMYDIATQYDEQSREEINYRLSDEITGQQLLYNYVYGHPESSMLFFPAGHVSSLINHNKETPNAKMVWSKHPGHQKHWFLAQPEQLLEEERQYIGLIIEIVATRDIEPGEEIFIDYGPEWQQAWEEHQARWEQGMEEGHIPKNWPVRAIDLNQIYRNDTHNHKFKTSQQLALEPYPHNIILKCFAVAEEVDEEESRPPRIEDGLRVLEWHQNDWLFDANDDIFDCEVIRRKEVKAKGETETKILYTVKRSKAGEEPDLIVEGLPHEAFMFVDKPGTGDQFFDSRFSFRHYIGIPDEIFPTGPWRDLKE